MAGRLVVGLQGAVAALVTGWLIAGRGAGDAGAAYAVALGMVVGTGLFLVVGGRRMWERERRLYDAWLNKQRRRQAGVTADT